MGRITAPADNADAIALLAECSLGIWRCLVGVRAIDGPGVPRAPSWRPRLRFPSARLPGAVWSGYLRMRAPRASGIARDAPRIGLRRGSQPSAAQDGLRCDRGARSRSPRDGWLGGLPSRGGSVMSEEAGPLRTSRA